MKKWIIQDRSKPKTEEEIVSILLKNRNFKSNKEKGDFFNPDFNSLSFQEVGLKNKEMEKAVERIKAAIQNSEPIVVYTDYDVDGVASGAIIWETLYEMGANVMPYVPHRLEEGYGLSEKGIDAVYKEYKAKLIITVDHGVTAKSKIDYAKKLGIDVIIIDHHTLPELLPEVTALVHTTNLCATGIAWFFADYLKKRKRNLRNLDLVCLATIADMIPLTGVNRTLAIYGLREMNKTKRPGLLALIKSAGLKLGDLGTYEIGHILAPRINASGRLTHALDSLRLLCTKDNTRAKIIAENLSAVNRERQLLLEENTKHAFMIIEKYQTTDEDRNKNSNKLIFLSHKSYNQGVIGLIAGKIVDEYYLPTIVISEGEKYSKASARSIAGFNIIEAIRSCSEFLVDAGGHPMAAGFTVETSKLQLLEKKLQETVQKKLTNDKLQKVLKIDCEINLNQVTENLFRHIKDFEPFGVGNPKPVFVGKKIKVVKASLVGKEGKHLKLMLQPDQKYNEYVNAIGFGLGEFYEMINFKDLVDIVFSIDKDEWNGNNRLQLKMKDVKFSSLSG